MVGGQLSRLCEGYKFRIMRSTNKDKRRREPSSIEGFYLYQYYTQAEDELIF